MNEKIAKIAQAIKTPYYRRMCFESCAGYAINAVRGTTSWDKNTPQSLVDAVAARIAEVYKDHDWRQCAQDVSDLVSNHGS